MPDDAVRYPRYRFPPAIISHAVWLYYRFNLSFRDVEDVLAQRGITVSYKTIRRWSESLAASRARGGFGVGPGPVGDAWHVDETLCDDSRPASVPSGAPWTNVGDVIDVLLPARREPPRCTPGFSALLERSCPRPVAPCRRSNWELHAAHRVVMPSVVHDATRRANNRAEDLPPGPARRHERHRAPLRIGGAASHACLVVSTMWSGICSRGTSISCVPAQQRLLRSRAL